MSILLPLPMHTRFHVTPDPKSLQERLATILQEPKLEEIWQIYNQQVLIAPNHPFHTSHRYQNTEYKQYNHRQHHRSRSQQQQQQQQQLQLQLHCHSQVSLAPISPQSTFSSTPDKFHILQICTLLSTTITTKTAPFQIIRKLNRIYGLSLGDYIAVVEHIIHILDNMIEYEELILFKLFVDCIGDMILQCCNEMVLPLPDFDSDGREANSMESSPKYSIDDDLVSARHVHQNYSSLLRSATVRETRAPVQPPPQLNRLMSKILVSTPHDSPISTRSSTTMKSEVSTMFSGHGDDGLERVKTQTTFMTDATSIIENTFTKNGAWNDNNTKYIDVGNRENYNHNNNNGTQVVNSKVYHQHYNEEYQGGSDDDCFDYLNLFTNQMDDQDELKKKKKKLSWWLKKSRRRL